jgi:imidazolonepropionase-like amidohydrolase
VPELDRRLGVDDMDVEGAPLIPGFIDPHAHVTGGTHRCSNRNSKA